MEHVADWAWTLDFPRTRRGSLLVKRGLDVVLSGALLVLFAPMLILVMMAIMLTSKGSALFVQRRIGYRCAEFDMYKFRTMIDGAERHENRLAQAQPNRTFLKIKDDPRTTPLGRLLRRYSIDELPQLYQRVPRRHEPARTASLAPQRSSRLPAGKPHAPFCDEAGHHRTVAGERPQSASRCRTDSAGHRLRRQLEPHA